ncbi:hypothetical protein [Tritonibacter horizontis]|uniref:Uncharacterized protein n=1 Tax=Tritonibacter horizontis TaxID=1768241 RepID=A0A132BY87_9RHOB|nr:hypothetical protein [Tritonibacter horizontis]KUP93348.1 hypothetical protein TRIHO_18450 [Tritonibacter horizontis]
MAFSANSTRSTQISLITRSALEPCSTSLRGLAASLATVAALAVFAPYANAATFAPQADTDAHSGALAQTTATASASNLFDRITTLRAQAAETLARGQSCLSACATAQPLLQSVPQSCLSPAAQVDLRNLPQSFPGLQGARMADLSTTLRATSLQPAQTRSC